MRKGTNFEYMFYSCGNLEFLDISGFEAPSFNSEGSINNMFTNCNKLKKIRCPSSFKAWALKNQDVIKLPTAMREGGTGTWELVN